MSRFWLTLGIVALIAGPAAAQTAAARPGTVRVTVRDATDLPIAGASVAVVAAAGGSATATTDQRGQAIVEGLAPGSYTVRIESPGFEPFSQSDVVVRSNARTSREVVLQIAGLVEQLDVAPADADRAVMDAFTTQLTADQIAALPDDLTSLPRCSSSWSGAMSSCASTALPANCRPARRSRKCGSVGTAAAPTARAAVHASRFARSQAAIAGGPTPISAFATKG